MQILKQINVDWKDRRIISELYVGQEDIIRVGDKESEPEIIGRGVRQGCPLSPLLSTIYSETMMIKAIEDIVVLPNTSYVNFGFKFALEVYSFSKLI